MISGGLLISGQASHQMFRMEQHSQTGMDGRLLIILDRRQRTDSLCSEVVNAQWSRFCSIRNRDFFGRQRKTGIQKWLKFWRVWRVLANDAAVLVSVLTPKSCWMMVCWQLYSPVKLNREQSSRWTLSITHRIRLYKFMSFNIRLYNFFSFLRVKSLWSRAHFF